MGVINVQFHSAALNKRVQYAALVPEVGDGPFPVLFQLHGLTDDYQMWLLHSNIARYAAEWPLMVVFPDGGTHAYMNWPSEGRLGRGNYEDLIIDDISRHLQRHFQVTSGPWAIGGLSMGGFGAMRLGLKHPDRFASIWAHSSKCEWDPGKEPWPDPVMNDVRLAELARGLLDHDPSRRPVLTFDCGVDDHLIEENRALHRTLDEMGFAHDYAEHPGAHTWEYWDEHVQEALEQHGRVLGLERVSS